jgi:hypothetical protein
LRRRTLALAVLAALALPGAAQAHGIGGIRDLPVPGWLFLFGGATVLVASFAALGVLWTTPRLRSDEDGRPLPPMLQRVLGSRVLRVVLGAASLGLFAVVFASAAFGSEQPNENLAPTFIYVDFWLGVVLLSVVLGNVWSVLSPWKVAADAVAWALGRAGRARAPREYPSWLGRWPATMLLFAFVTLELVYTEPANPRVLAQAILVYSVVTWTGAAVYGRRGWFDNGDGFSVYFGLLSRIAPFATRARDGGREIVLRRPFSGLTPVEGRPGTVAFVATMLGSVAFDGLSRATFWQDRLFSIRAPLVEDDPELADLLGMGFNLLGLIAAVSFVAFAYLAAVQAAQAVAGRTVSLEGIFVGSLFPIAFVYVVAHYFSYFLIQGQYTAPLLSDPFGRGWDLIGTADVRTKIDLLSPNTVWYVQVGVLVAGHVLGLVVAHDRALANVRPVSRAGRTQYALLALMVLYTVGGMWLLSLD